MNARDWINEMNSRLYGDDSVFTTAEQNAMRRGYTRVERLAVSGCVFLGYPQAISEEHARKIQTLNRSMNHRAEQFA
jgi:hypothetical protein